MPEGPAAPSHIRTWLLVLLRTAGAALLLWLAWRQAEDWPAFWRREKLQVGWVLTAFLAGGAALAGWAVRWWLLVRAVGVPMPFGEALRLTLCADFFNFYFLGPLGADGFRIMAVGRRFPGKHGAAATSIFLDHVVGMFGGTVMFLALTVPRWSQLTAGDGVGAAAIKVAGVALVVLVLVTLPPFFATSRLGRRLGAHRFPVPRFGRPIAEQCALLADHPRLAAATLGASVVASLGHYGAFAAAALALEAPVRTGDLLALMPAVEGLASIPFTISGLGVRENLLVDLLGRVFATPGETALAVSLLGFAAVGAWGAIGGVALLVSREAKA